MIFSNTQTGSHAHGNRHNHCADVRPRKCPSHGHPDRTSSVYKHISTSLKMMQDCNSEDAGSLFLRSWPEPGEWACHSLSLKGLMPSRCCWVSVSMTLFFTSSPARATAHLQPCAHGASSGLCCSVKNASLCPKSVQSAS